MPVEVAGNHSFKSIACGASHTCGLESLSKNAWCWGVSEASECVRMNSLHWQALYTATAGCSHMLSLLCSHSPLSGCPCLQWNPTGQLGDGAADDQRSPVPVSGSHAFAAISAGYSHTCAIKVDSSLLCWGEAPGNGLDVSPSNWTNTPAEVRSNNSFVSLSAAWDFTCALDDSSNIWCFGKHLGPAVISVRYTASSHTDHIYCLTSCRYK